MFEVKIRGWNEEERICARVSSLMNLAPTFSSLFAIRSRARMETRVESRLLRLESLSLSLHLSLQICARRKEEQLYTREKLWFWSMVESSLFGERNSTDNTLFRVVTTTHRWDEIERETRFHGNFNDFVMRIDWTWAKNKRDNYPRGKRGWITDICISTFRYPTPERTYLILSQLDTRQFASLDLRRTRDLVSLLSPVNYTSIEHRQRNRAAMHTPRRIWSRATLVRITYQFWISRNHCPVPLIQHWIICVCPKIGTSVVISLVFFIRSSNRFFDTRLIWFDRRPLFESNILFFCKRTKWWGEMTN